jgi:hypothetical protein
MAEIDAMDQTTIDEAMIEHIAERAAEKALSKVYQEVGKSAVRTILWVVGAATLALLAVLAGKGAVKA